MTKGSGDARMQPLYFLITTAGTDTHSICYETHQKAKDILEGRKIDPTFYPVIYGADEADDWTDPKVWKKANPSLNITVGIDKVEAACESAKQNPGEENSFRQLRLNQWVKQAVRWMPMDKWDACAFPVSEDGLEGRVCYGGLDLSSTTDITAFVLVFPPLDEEDKYCILPYFWVPEETLELLGRLGDHQATFLLTAEELEQADLVRALVAGGHGLALQTRGETEAEMEEEIVRARELVWQAACAWLELVWCGDGAEELLSQLGCVRVTAQISASGDLDRAGQAAALMRAVRRYREDVSLSLGGDGSGLGGLGALLEDLDAGGYRLSAWRLTA